MANYTKATDFQSKDALLTGNPAKIIKGSEINDEFNAIQTAVATKADLASPAFTGTPTAATQASGNSSTRLATTAFVQAEITANEASVAITGGTIAGVAITGGTISGLTTDLAVADGGTGASSFTLNSVVLGNNVGALNGNMVAPGTSGNALVSNGTTWTSAPLQGITHTTGSAPYFGARAFAKINGNTGGLIAGQNIASTSRTSAGKYTINFTTAMPDADYAIISTNFWRNAPWNEYVTVTAQSASSFSIVVTDGGDVNTKDVPSVYVVVFR